MKFFIDTANVEDIKKANDMGVICGVTTNPSLIAKEGRNFEEVIAVGKEDGMVIGAPVVEGAKVVAKVLKNGKGKKITVFTYRSKKDSKRKMGHRQPYTKVEIVSINA